MTLHSDDAERLTRLERERLNLHERTRRAEQAAADLRHEIALTKATLALVQKTHALTFALLRREKAARWEERRKRRKATLRALALRRRVHVLGRQADMGAGIIGVLMKRQNNAG
jgi:hypothetical protein